MVRFVSNDAVGHISYYYFVQDIYAVDVLWKCLVNCLSYAANYYILNFHVPSTNIPAMLIFVTNK